MSEAPPDRSASAMRRAFDQSFACLPPESEADLEDLLAIRVAGEPYAIRLGHVAAVAPVPKVLSIPSETPGLLGIAGIRGALVPVFELAALLGHDASPTPPRWMLLSGHEAPTGLAFHEIEGHRRVARNSLHAVEREGPRSRFVAEVARMTPEVRPVIGIHLVLGAIRNRAGSLSPAREQ